MTPEDLKALRLRTGLKQRAFAQELGLSLRAYQLLEAGASPIRRLHALAAGAVIANLGAAQAAPRPMPAQAPNQEVQEDAREVIGHLLIEVIHLQGRLASVLKQAARATAIGGASDAIILEAIAMSSRVITAPRLARSLGYSRQAVHRVIDNLKARGLISLSEGPTAQAGRVLRQTERGQAMVMKNRDENSAWMEEVAHGVALPDLEGAIGVVKYIRRALESHEERDGSDSPP
ncbi:MAG: hypothetical protein JWO33_1534 [Caulobacteraceae bacterium]|nr:hypothetical protein [Caulobacteraceae bacterium]